MDDGRGADEEGLARLNDMDLYEKTRKQLMIGIIGYLLYVCGDFLFSATGKGQTTEMLGMFTRVAYLDMSTWRMVVSILCGFVGTLMYYMGFHRFYWLLRRHRTAEKHPAWMRIFHTAYITGTVAWTWVHAMFMTDALVFRFVYQAYGDMQQAADIANRVFYANAPGMAAAYILCDIGLSAAMIAMVWKGVIPLKSQVGRILATMCNPIMCPGLVGNLLSLFPWPLNQLDHGTESFGHALVLMLGIILLKEMHRSGELHAGYEQE
ncbi:MAG: hypothetical protein IJ246_00820 [Clostridia bacterium]|nr:hypothetical protein [Clostridia bacterium]